MVIEAKSFLHVECNSQESVDQQIHAPARTSWYNYRPHAYDYSYSQVLRSIQGQQLRSQLGQPILFFLSLNFFSQILYACSFRKPLGIISCVYQLTTLIRSSIMKMLYIHAWPRYLRPQPHYSVTLLILTRCFINTTT